MKLEVMTVWSESWYEVFIPLRTQTCSNDVLSVYSSTVTNSSEGSAGTEGSEMQD